VKQGSAVLLLGAMLVSGAALASEPPRHAPSATPAVQHVAAKTWMTHGVISAVDAINKTVTIREGKASWTFETTAATTFLAAQKPGVWNDLKVGDKVAVAYQLRGTQRIAREVKVER